MECEWVVASEGICMSSVVCFLVHSMCGRAYMYYMCVCVCVSAICIYVRMVHKHGCMRVLYIAVHVWTCEQKVYRHPKKLHTYQTLYTVVQPRWALWFQPPKELFQSRKCVSGVARDLLLLEWAGCKIGRSHDFPSCSIICTLYSQYTSSETCTFL